jgi:hypothetical protein
LQECCACPIPPDGDLTFSVNTNLTGYPVLGGRLQRGLIEIVSSVPNPVCDPTAVAPKAGLRAWLSHPELSTGNQYNVSVETMTDSTLRPAQVKSLDLNCSVIFELELAGTCSCPAD